MSIDQAASDLFTFITSPMTGVPAGLKAKLKETMHPRHHAHVGVVEAVELIYRHRTSLPVSALNLGAAMAEAAGTVGAGGLNQDNRGSRIGAAIRKMQGVEQKPALDTTDPEPRAELPPTTPA